MVYSAWVQVSVDASRKYVTLCASVQFDTDCVPLAMSIGHGKVHFCEGLYFFLLVGRKLIDTHRIPAEVFFFNLHRVCTFLALLAVVLLFTTSFGLCSSLWCCGFSAAAHISPVSYALAQATLAVSSRTVGTSRGVVPTTVGALGLLSLLIARSLSLAPVCVHGMDTFAAAHLLGSSFYAVVGASQLEQSSSAFCSVNFENLFVQVNVFIQNCIDEPLLDL